MNDTAWAMEQVRRVFGFADLEAVRAALVYDQDGIATIKRNGWAIVATRNPRHWARIKLVWPGVGVQNEAAIEYGQQWAARAAGGGL